MLRPRTRNTREATRERELASRLPLRAATSSSQPPAASLRSIFILTWAAYLFLASSGLKGVAWLMQLSPALTRLGSVLSVCGSIGLLVALGYYLYLVIRLIRQGQLWRVRQKLIVSYLFIGFVPALLLVAFFTLGGLVMFRLFSSYLFKSGFDDLIEQIRVQADTAALEIERGAGVASARSVLERKHANLVRRYPGISFALVPIDATVPDPADKTTRGPQNAATTKGSPEETKGRKPANPVKAIAVGPWEHVDAPTSLPAWIGKGGFGGALAYREATRGLIKGGDEGSDNSELVIRAVGLPETAKPQFAVIADSPFDLLARERIREGAGLRVGGIALGELEVETGPQDTGRVRRVASTPAGVASTWSDSIGNWVAMIKYSDWENGQSGQASVALRVRIREIYQRLIEIQPLIGNGWRLSDVIFLFLAIIAGLFLFIEIVALMMGAALARSITGSVHELFMGTERVRQGDLTHRIVVKTRDQLGELSESFNAMIASIEDLLVQAAEKRRLEEELRIARQIQMSLLPRGPLLMPGLTVAALCVPAREVGGDYYDFFPLGAQRVGLLIADVSGKGTSAALYMAELKGLMLSLSQIYDSPRLLLKAVNHIISENLDSRSFITMTYAVLDLAAGTLVYARAGHTPLIYVPAGGRPRAQVLTPDGMVLGLRLPGIEEKFDLHTTEETIVIGTGDIFVFFTDGITEAMNPEEDLFGEARLARLVEEHRDLTCEELRERVLREVEAFVGTADQHDDMTMILLKIDHVAALRDDELTEELVAAGPAGALSHTT